jgi:Flp pilus assembly protein CpaB
MAYVEGQSLAEWLKVHGRFQDPHEAVELVRQMAEALDAVHAHGIIHRDLKPGNILIRTDGQAILSDFGLARPDQDTEHLTAEGMVIGTPAYMAPEQASGDGSPIGPPTDLYSLGVVLYQMLTGRLPFEGPVLSMFHKIVYEKPPAPSQLRPDLDPILEKIMLKTISRRPKDRYENARAFARVLEQWSAGETIAESDRGPRGSKQRLPILIAIAVSAMFLLVLIAGQIIIHIKGKDGNPDLEVKLTTETIEILVAARDLPLGTLIKEPETLFKVKRFFKTERPKSAITDYDQLRGKHLGVSLAEDQFCRESDLTVGGIPSLLLEKGMRAFSIKLSREDALAGFLLPNMHVDVISVVQQGGGDTSAKVILSDIRVLAVDTQMAKPGGQEIHTVTLSVKPEEAEKLAMSFDSSKLRLVLRAQNNAGEKKNSKAMDGRIAPGMRAVALALPDSGAAGFVKAESRVDIVSVVRGDASFSAKTILQDIRVLAVDPGGPQAKDRGATLPSVVTLELTPDQALKLAQAVHIGTVRLVLRAFDGKKDGRD